MNDSQLSNKFNSTDHLQSELPILHLCKDSDALNESVTNATEIHEDTDHLLYDFSCKPGDNEMNIQYLGIDEIYELIGFGKFHYVAMFIIGGSMACDFMEISLLAFIQGCVVSSLGDDSDFYESLLTSSTFCGQVIGLMTLGSMADTYGRKPVILIGWTLIVVFGILSSFSPNIWLLIAARTIVGFGIGSSQTVAYDLFVEIIPPNLRSRLIYCSYVGLIGQVYLVAMAWVFLDNYGWRWVCFATALPTVLVTLFGICYLYESPRWLISQGLEDNAWELILKIASWNQVSESLRHVRLKPFDPHEFRSAGPTNWQGGVLDSPRYSDEFQAIDDLPAVRNYMHLHASNQKSDNLAIHSEIHSGDTLPYHQRDSDTFSELRSVQTENEVIPFPQHRQGISSSKPRKQYTISPYNHTLYASRSSNRTGWALTTIEGLFQSSLWRLTLTLWLISMFQNFAYYCVYLVIVDSLESDSDSCDYSFSFLLLATGMSIVGIAACHLFIDRIGRVATLSHSLYLSTVLLFVYLLLRVSGYLIASLGILLISLVTIVTSTTTMWVFIVESYPTDVSQFLLQFCHYLTVLLL